MATIFNQSTVAAKPPARRRRQQLLTKARVPGSGILLDRLTLERGRRDALAVPAASVAWISRSTAKRCWRTATSAKTLTDAHVRIPAARLCGNLHAAVGAALLYGEIPTPGVSTPGFKQNPPPFRLADWTREPVLDSEHDARKRIYL